MSLAEYGPLLSRSLQAAERRVLGDPSKVAVESAERAALAKLSTRPIPFVRAYLGERTLPTSRAILRALAKHRFVHVCGCRKSSKSHTAAQAVLAMVCTAPTRCIVTSSTYTQVRENIFARIRQLHNRARRPLPGVCGVTSIRFPDPTHFAKGISVSKPGNIMGFHGDVSLPPHYEYDEERIDEDSLLPPDPKAAEEDARQLEFDPIEQVYREVYAIKKAIDREPKTRLFFVLDEMAEMRPEIVEAMAGSWMGENVYVLSQFNPTFAPESEHPAARFLRKDSRFHRIHISGREPLEGMHDGAEFDQCFHGVPPEIMPQQWVDERLADWGKNSPLTACHVYGLPAASFSDYQFIPRMLIRENEVEDASGDLDEYQLGVDVGASESGDPSVACLLVGGTVAAMHEWHAGDTMATASMVLRLMQEWGLDGRPVPAQNVHVDYTGVGRGVVDRLRQMGEWVDGVEFAESMRHVSPRLNGSMLFRNVKAELFWTLRRLLEERELYIPPRFRRVREQAGWYTYRHHVRGTQTFVEMGETKPEIKKRFGRSPDHIEALVLALARNGPGRSGVLFVDDL